MLKSLTFLAKSKSLSFREKRMPDRASSDHLRGSEVMRETAAAIEGRVDSALERCFSAKANGRQGQGGKGCAARGRRRLRCRRGPRAAVAAPRAAAASNTRRGQAS